MSRFDIVIFGATGFTGKHAVKEALKLSKKYSFTWAVAGRSPQKLNLMLAEIAEKTGEDVSTVKTLIADIDDSQSLRAMCSVSRVIANCCGPYRFYGEPVVKACIDCGTHYVDVSGEPQFIETIQLKYDALAREKGVYVVSACGFDSIPNDMGVVFLQENFGGVVNSIESHLSVHTPAEHFWSALMYGSIHYGTWESLVHSVGNWGELRTLRKALYPTPMPAFTPKLRNRTIIHRNGSSWCLPFPGADNSIVYRTQRRRFETNGLRPAQFRAYVKIGNIVSTITFLLYASLMFLFCYHTLTRWLLLAYPRVFTMGMVSHSGPAEVVSDNTRFRFRLEATGWSNCQDVVDMSPDKKVVAQVTGVNPGYGATVVGLLLCAVTIVKETDRMPATFGVMTTGTAFKNTNLVKHLTENNFKFSIVKSE